MPLSNSSSGSTVPNKLSPLGTFGALLKRSKTHLESPFTSETRALQESEIKSRNHLHLGVSSPPSPEVSVTILLVVFLTISEV